MMPPLSGGHARGAVAALLGAPRGYVVYFGHLISPVGGVFPMAAPLYLGFVEGTCGRCRSTLPALTSRMEPALYLVLFSFPTYLYDVGRLGRCPAPGSSGNTVFHVLYRHDMNKLSHRPVWRVA